MPIRRSLKATAERLCVIHGGSSHLELSCVFSTVGTIVVTDILLCLFSSLSTALILSAMYLGLIMCRPCFKQEPYGYVAKWWSPQCHQILDPAMICVDWDKYDPSRLTAFATKHSYHISLEVYWLVPLAPLTTVYSKETCSVGEGPRQKGKQHQSCPNRQHHTTLPHCPRGLATAKGAVTTCNSRGQRLYALPTTCNFVLHNLTACPAMQGSTWHCYWGSKTATT